MHEIRKKLAYPQYKTLFKFSNMNKDEIKNHPLYQILFDVFGEGIGQAMLILE